MSAMPSSRSAAEAGHELVEIEAVLRARERRAEAAVFAFEHVDDAGEALFGEQRAIEAALRRAAGMHALDHRAELRGHQPRGLRAGDAERVHRLFGIEPQRGAAPAAAENTPTVAPECQPCAMCSGPMHMPTRGPIS